MCLFGVLCRGLSDDTEAQHQTTETLAQCAALLAIIPALVAVVIQSIQLLRVFRAWRRRNRRRRSGDELSRDMLCSGGVVVMP